MQKSTNTDAHAQEEGVKARIRKMLELGLHKDTGEQEARQALVNAMRLLTKHNLKHADVLLNASAVDAGALKVYLCVYIYIYMCLHIYLYIPIPTHTSIHTYVYMYIYRYIHTYTYVHTYIYTNIYILCIYILIYA